jgi:hypothetical protein
MKYFTWLIVTLFVSAASAHSSFFELKLQLLTEQIKSGFLVELQSSKIIKKITANSKGIRVLNSMSYVEVYKLILFKEGFVTKTFF